MASLNTLRTRFGILLSAIIAFALIAFIFSLKTEMGFGGNDPVVAKIDGKDIAYSEYITEYENIKMLSGVSDSDEYQSEMLARSAWQAIVSRVVMEPGFDQMGLEISEAERLAIIRGEIPTQTMYSNFYDQSTGQYNISALNSFLLTAQGNTEAERAWALINDQARVERESNKYAVLTSAAINLNSLEIEAGLEAANNSFSGRWATKRYSTVADSLVSVTSAEIKAYYDKTKSSYKREATRSVSYVTFNINPSESDLKSVELEATQLGEGLAATADIRAFLREKRRGSVAQTYVAEAQLPANEASVLVTGATFGPEKSGNNWRISRVEDIVFASDTLSLRQIVLPYTESKLADSLYAALKSNGSAFVEAANTYSVAQGAANGGDIGKVPFSALTDEFAATLAPAKSGAVVKFEIGDMIQIMQVYDVTKRNKQYRLASIDLPIVPSNETRTIAHNKAGAFVVAAKGTDSFRDAANEAGVAPHSSEITSATRVIAALPGSYEMSRWAHTAKVGDISPIFTVNDGYVVALLSAVNDSEYSPLSAVEATIKQTLTNDKKFEYIASKVSGSTLEEQAASMGGEIKEFEGVSFGSFYIAGVGVEPRLIGAISSSAEGVVGSPVRGNTGVYLYEVASVKASADPQTAEAERVRVESMAAQAMQQRLFSAIESMADVKDLRGQVL